MRRLLLGLLVILQGAQIVAQRGNTLSGGGSTFTTTYMVASGNGINPNADLSDVPNIPPAWRSQGMVFEIGADAGLALEGYTDLNSRTGYTVRFDFYLGSDAMTTDTFCSIHVGKGISALSFDHADTPIAYYIDIYKTTDNQRKLRVRYPTDGGEVIAAWSGTVGLQTVYRVTHEYNLRESSHTFTVNGDTVVDRALDGSAIQSIDTLVYGSSAGSTCRNVQFLLGRRMETPIQPAPFTASVLPSKPVLSGDSPANGATEVPLTGQSLGCAATNALTYRLFFDDVNPPVDELTLTNSSVCGYALPSLENGTTYYWRATPSNATGSTTGDVWSFATIAAPTNGDLDIVAASANCADSNDNSPTGRNPKLLWTCARQEAWKQAVADYEAVGCSSASGVTCSATPATLGGKWFKVIKGYADAKVGANFNDWGNWNVLAYQMTGDAQYITNTISGFWPKINARWIVNAPPRDPNLSRQVNSMFTICAEWAWPALSDTQRLALIGEIDEDNDDGRLRYMGGTFPWIDSDQLIGQGYFPIALMRVILPNNVSNNALWNDSEMGGFTATAANLRTTARNAIKYYFTVPAAGGQYIEGPQYDRETVVWTIVSAQAISDAQGSDQFPEITAWLPDFTNQVLAHLTPDLRKSVQFSDEQDPEVLKKFEIGDILRALSGLQQGTAAGQKAHQLLLDLTTEHGTTGFGSMEPHNFKWFGYTVFNADATAADWKTSKSFYASGMETMYLRSGWTDSDSLFFTHCDKKHADPVQGTVFIDHQVWYLCDWQLFNNGEWVNTHPFSYAGASNTGEATNTMRFNGWGEGREYKQVRAHDVADTHAFMSAVTGGSRYHSGYYQAPPVSLNEGSRSILHIPGTIPRTITHDRAHVDEIEDTATDLQRYTPTGTQGCVLGGRNFILQQHARQEYIHHTPTAPTFAAGSYTWTTPQTQQTVTWTPLLPASQTRTVYDLATTFAQNLTGSSARCDWASSEILVGAPFYYTTDGGGYDRKVVKIWPETMGTFHTYLNVFQVGSSVTTPTLITNSNAECVHVPATGQNDVLACFNGTTGTALNDTAWHSTHAAILDSARLRGTGSFTVAYTAVATTTELYLADLNSSGISWAYTVDGGASTPIADATLDASGGFIRISLSLAAGAHTIVVTGS